MLVYDQTQKEQTKIESQTINLKNNYEKLLELLD